MEAVSNTTVLIALAKIDKLMLLKNIFSRIFIPPAVEKELFAKRDIFQQECELLQRAIEKEWILVEKSVTREQFPGLGVGEQEAIALCRRKNNAFFLSDDAAARILAEALRLDVLGTVGILIKNHQIGKITKEEYIFFLGELIKIGRYLSTDLYHTVLHMFEQERK